MGGLPWLVAQPGFKAAIYATQPVHKMGQAVLVDAYLSRANYEHITTITFEQILTACEKIKPLKPLQKERLFEVEISPHRAGHSLGGSAWKITFNLQDIVYAPRFNPHGERHLDGLDFEYLKNPTVMITDPTVGEIANESVIIEKIIGTLNEAGNVLIPITTAGRALELLLVIDDYWDRFRDRLEPFSVAFLGNMAHQTIEYAKSHLEYMPEALRNFETNPFTLNYVKLIDTIEELPQEPICVLASMENLEYGFSHKIMERFASDSQNLVLFIESPESGSFSEHIFTAEPGTIIDIEDKTIIEHAGESVDTAEGDWTSQAVTDAEQPVEEAMEIENDLIFPMFPKWQVKSDADRYGETCEMQWEVENDAGEEGEDGDNQAAEMTPFIVLKEKDDRRKRYGVCQTRHVQLTLNWQKAFVPLQGLPDNVGYKLTIAKLQPKNLVLLDRNEFLDGLYGSIIRYAPLELEMMPVRPITINEDLYESLKFQNIDRHDVAYIKGDLVDDPNGLSIVPSIEPYTNSNLFLGDLDIVAFKSMLTERGLQAEFHEGCLVVKTAGKPRIKIFKDQGRLSFESVVCQEYFLVRKLLYGNFVYL